MTRVGLVGLGLLGSALASRLLEAGLSVLGHDLDPARRAALAQRGGEPADSAGEVLARCPRVLLCLPTSGVVRSVLEGAADQLRPGLLILDSTTGDPEDTVAHGELLAARGVGYLDATVVGSSVVVSAGEGVFLVGGSGAHLESFQDVRQALGGRWFHLGAVGSGAVTKLVVNLVLGLHRAVLAEGLALARDCGLDEARTLEVLQAGAAYSRVMEAKGPKMLVRDFTPQARLAQHAKDVELIRALARRVGARTPLSDVHHALLAGLLEAGHGALDNAAILRAYDPPGEPGSPGR